MGGGLPSGCSSDILKRVLLYYGHFSFFFYLSQTFSTIVFSLILSRFYNIPYALFKAVLVLTRGGGRLTKKT